MTFRKLNVVVVDDDYRVLESLESLLESRGHRPQLFSSAGQFLEDVNLEEIDCLISDIDMPRFDGLELLQTVQRKRKNLPVILITGKPSEQSEEFYLSRGARSFLRKPFLGEALLLALDALSKSE